jgi:hypothetical protein
LALAEKEHRMQTKEMVLFAINMTSVTLLFYSSRATIWIVHFSIQALSVGVCDCHFFAILEIFMLNCT